MEAFEKTFCNNADKTEWDCTQLKRKIKNNLTHCNIGEFFPKVYTNEDFLNNSNKELKEQIYQHLIDVETTTNRGESFLRDIQENKMFIFLTLWQKSISSEGVKAKEKLVATICFSFDIDAEIKSYLNIKNDAIWLSKLVIRKDMRAEGIGKALILRSNKILLSLPEIKYLCGDTVYFGAIKLYKNLGVTIFQKDINTLYNYCNKEQNQRYFDELSSNHIFKEFKSKQLIRFWYTSENIDKGKNIEEKTQN